tara:strand:- start:355 stop:612 length:258 start_codon:yes stop_codon:yes gene_type:complete
MAPSKTVTFRDGTVASLPVLQCLWGIEARGGRFVALEGDGFRIEPPSSITPAEQTFLKAHREEAGRLVRYVADDAHLTRAMKDEK